MVDYVVLRVDYGRLQWIKSGLCCILEDNGGLNWIRVEYSWLVGGKRS